MIALLLAMLAQQPALKEQITVERVIVDVRVTDAAGNPMTGLRPSDFRVKIDGTPAAVESADWIAEARVIPPVIPSEARNPPPAAPRRGRLLVYFFQEDFARQALRVGGHMKLLLGAQEWVDFLEPADRVAVLSFDSHLKFRLDFTADKAAIVAAMERTLWFDEPPPPIPAADGPSLRLDGEAMLHTYSMESALIALGNALAAIEGPKSLILFGWGMGRFGPGGVSMARNYGVAAQTLQGARVTVFSVDITQASGHSLAVGLGAVAADTGGLYVSTGMFSKKAVERVRNALAGHYELEVRKPPAARATRVHRIEVDVARRGAAVMARSTFTDR